MNKEILVSVIIPAYNREKYIERAAASVLNQTYQNLECIVVDDNSTDNTGQIVLNMNDPRVRYFRNEKNLGASGARNRGILEAEGHYIAFNDSDDVWHPDKLSKQIGFLTDNPKYHVVYSAYRLKNAEECRRIPDIRIKEKLHGLILPSLFECNKIGTPVLMMSREVIESAGYFNENMNAYEDYEFALRIAKLYEIGYIDEVLVDAYALEGVNSNIKNKVDGRLTILEENRNESMEVLAPFILSTLKEMVWLADNESKIQKLNELLNLFEFTSLEKKFLRDCFNSLNESKEREGILKLLIQKRRQIVDRGKAFSGRLMVYGNGQTGRLIADLLQEHEVHIIGMIDQNEVSYNKLPSYKKNEIPKDTDIIVINSLPESIVSSAKLESELEREVVPLCRLIE